MSSSATPASCVLRPDLYQHHIFLTLQCTPTRSPLIRVLRAAARAYGIFEREVASCTKHGSAAHFRTASKAAAARREELTCWERMFSCDDVQLEPGLSTSWVWRYLSSTPGGSAQGPLLFSSSLCSGSSRCLKALGSRAPPPHGSRGCYRVYAPRRVRSSPLSSLCYVVLLLSVWNTRRPTP